MAICTSITKIDNIAGVGDVLEVVIDNSTTALWFFSYADSLKFLNQEVIVEYRKDIYNGELKQFIATFTIPTVVQTLDKKDNIKLYVDQVDNGSNISFNEIEDGETRMGCIVYCTASEYKSSPKAAWMELIIRDHSMHTAVLRLFDYETKSVDFSGQYIKTTLARNAYGFTTELVKPVDGTVFKNPEIELAKEYITNYFLDDGPARHYVEATAVLEAMENFVDYEKGYGLMRLAMELSMCDSLQNTTKDVDLQAIGNALLAMNGHFTVSSVLSDEFNNMVIANKHPWTNRKLVMQLVDVNIPESEIPEKKVLNSIKSCINTIIEVRKGTR